jgi:hypothetical protein
MINTSGRNCRESIPMSQKLLEVITLGHCSHEFSWPRRAPDGDYYQVCLVCATQYKYDWQAMRRTERVENATTEALTASPTHRNRKPSWVPRARRLKLQIPLRYRAKGQTFWSEGAVENLSQSGVLFRGSEPLPQNTLVEMIFEMPEEISGQKNSTVLCQGRVTRVRLGSDKAEDNTVLAATVLDYKFLRQN